VVIKRCLLCESFTHSEKVLIVENNCGRAVAERGERGSRRGLFGIWRSLATHFGPRRRLLLRLVPRCSARAVHHLDVLVDDGLPE
jgi:hypothetical protein